MRHHSNSSHEAMSQVRHAKRPVKMRDEGLIKFDIDGGPWLIA
jgi:hypothetical protein